MSRTASGGKAGKTSTVSPTVSAEIGKELAARGIAYLRAPVSGNPTAAEAGKLTAMVSGPKEAFEVTFCDRNTGRVNLRISSMETTGNLRRAARPRPCRGGSGPDALKAPIMTRVCRFGWAGISGMAAFPTLLNRDWSHPSIRTRWRMPLRDLILPLREGIPRSWFRSSRTDRIPLYSSRCTARTPSTSLPRSRSANSSVRHSLRTNPREKSALLAPSMMPPNMGRHQEPVPENVQNVTGVTPAQATSAI